MIRFNKFIAVAALAASSAGFTALAGAQAATSMTKPFSFGISGGASIPTGALSDYTNTGYNLNGHFGIGFAPSPLSLRGDVGYNSWGAKSGGGDAHAWSLVGNGILSVPTAMTAHPYLLAGVGAFKPGLSYNNAGSTTTVNSDSWKFGFNLGGGITIPLTGFNTFIEAKYTQINGDNGAGSTKFVPITFGIMF